MQFIDVAPSYSSHLPFAARLWWPDLGHRPVTYPFERCKIIKNWWPLHFPSPENKRDGERGVQLPSDSQPWQEVQAEESPAAGEDEEKIVTIWAGD